MGKNRGVWHLGKRERQVDCWERYCLLWGESNRDYEMLCNGERNNLLPGTLCWASHKR